MDINIILFVAYATPDIVNDQRDLLDWPIWSISVGTVHKMSMIELWKSSRSDFELHVALTSCITQVSN